MTGASKLLFYNWRSRAGRKPEPDPDLDSLSRNARRSRHGHGPHGHGHGRRFHQRSEDFDTSLSSRNYGYRSISQMERESVQLDYRDSGELETSNRNVNGVPDRLATRFSIIRNDRLPDTVLQARKRLLERLRGVSLAGNRQTSTISGISWDDCAVSHDFSVDVFGGQDDENKKPSGLEWDDLHNLHHEVFNILGGSGCTRTLSSECCICLEYFCEGDDLIRLTCGHRFHPLCLEPWARTCGDCPYCRANMVCLL